MATTLTPSITVTEERNINFTPEQKEILKWNYRLPKKGRNRFSGPWIHNVCKTPRNT